MGAMAIRPRAYVNPCMSSFISVSILDTQTVDRRGEAKKIRGIQIA